MLITLVREPSRDSWTLGLLSIDGRFQCFICEDVVRPAGEPKVPGKTAIPAGRYRIAVTHSPRFQRQLPLLMGVPGFSGIRIHPGNTHEHTEGCLLPGTDHDGRGVKNSQVAFDRLFGRLLSALAANNEVWIEISERAVERPPAVPDTAPVQQSAAPAALDAPGDAAGNGAGNG
jgi:hypothetical protein